MVKSFFILILVSIYFSSMAQNNVETMNNIERVRLSKKEVKEIIVNKHGKLNDSLTKERFNPTYILDDNKVVVFFDTHGYLYNSSDDLREWVNNLKIKKKSAFNILENRLLFGKDFGNHSFELIDFINEIFKIKGQKPSLKQLKVIDSLILKQSKNLSFDNFFFSGMVAYVGEVFKNELPNSVWVSIKSINDSTIWEPYIVLGEKKYNPFFLVYRELFEELPETNNISIYDRAVMELTSVKPQVKK